MEAESREEMTRYVATFHSQYGAVQFFRQAKKVDFECRLAPVPRALSSSCGTCAHYAGSGWNPGFPLEDLEAVYVVSEGRYHLVHTTEDAQ